MDRKRWGRGLIGKRDLISAVRFRLIPIKYGGSRTHGREDIVGEVETDSASGFSSIPNAFRTKARESGPIPPRPAQYFGSNDRDRPTNVAVQSPSLSRLLGLYSLGFCLHCS